MTRFSEIKDEYLGDEEWEDIALILKDAMYRLENDGWIQGNFYQNVQTGQRRYCAVGSVMAAVQIRLEHNDPMRDQDAPLDAYRDNNIVHGITQLLDDVAKRYYLLRPADGVINFNDASGTTKEDVLGVFRQALDFVHLELGY
jgi:hypothetical protein